MSFILTPRNREIRPLYLSLCRGFRFRNMSCLLHKFTTHDKQTCLAVFVEKKNYSLQQVFATCNSLICLDHYTFPGNCPPAPPLSQGINTCVVTRATSLFNSFSSNVATQGVRFCAPFHCSLSVVAQNTTSFPGFSPTRPTENPGNEVVQNSNCECFFFFFARSCLVKQFSQHFMGE